MTALSRRFRTSISFLFFIITFSVFGQRSNIDQQLVKYLRDKADLEQNYARKAPLYNKISSEYLLINSFDSVKHYSEKVTNLNNKTAKVDLAIAYKNVAEVSSQNRDLRGKSSIKKDFHENIKKAIELFTDIQDFSNLAESYRLFSNYYTIYHDHRSFLQFNTKASSLFKQLNDSLGMAKCQVDLAKINAISRKYDLAEDQLHGAIRVFKDKKDTLWMITAYSDFGHLYRYKSDLKKQLQNFQTAYELSNNIGDKKKAAYAYNFYAEALIKSNSPAKAKIILLEALDYAKTYKADILISLIYNNMAEAYIGINDYKTALAYKDSSYNSFKLNAVKANQEISEFEKYEKEIELKRISDERVLNRTILLSVLLSLLFGLLSIIYIQKKRSSIKLEKKSKIIDEKNRELISINQNLESLVQERSGEILRKNAELELEIQKSREYQLELVKAKEVAQEADSLKSTLISNISHEFRTPLNGILGFSEILEDELDKSELKDFISKIRQSAKRLLGVLNSVLTAMELTNNDYFIEKSDFDLEEAVIGVIRNYEREVAQKSLQLKLEFKLNRKNLYFDKNILLRSINCLIENAIKYTNTGEVQIHCFNTKKEDKAYICISVKDTGIGIKDSDKKKLFYEFRQLSTGYSREYEGLGLGLALSQKLMKLVGGDITFESEYNKGSNFVLWIQDFEMSEETVKKRNEVTAAPIIVNSDTVKIMVVEDNIINAETLKLFLNSAGKVDVAFDGESGLNLAINSNYNIFIVDINLGKGIDGIQFMERVKKIDNQSKAKFIALTGYASSKSEMEFIGYGFDAYIPKPADKNQLLNKVNELIIKKND
jgi:signal transduction histidine kinase/CheY-like chemotaxis protein